MRKLGCPPHACSSKRKNGEPQQKRNLESAKNLAEEVFFCGPDDFRSGLVRRPMAVPANNDDRTAFGFAHEKSRGGGQLIGDGENCGAQDFALPVARAAKIEE
jgi:hypothetical protein